MLLLADYRLGAEGAFTTGLNEVAIGMTMPPAAMQLAEERIAPQWLSRCALQAESMDPAQALQAGFLDELAAPEQLLDKARAKLAKLAALDRKAYRETRQLMNAPLRERILPLLNLSL